MKSYLPCIVSSILLFAFWAQSAIGKPETGFTLSERNHLVKILSEEGFNKSDLRRIFYSPRLTRLPNLIKQNVINRVSGNPYAQFYSPYSINLAWKFLNRWRTLLHRASKKFDVDKHVIASILLVETSFGNYLGKTPVISVFSSLLIENTPERKSALVSELAESDKEKAYYQKRIQQKADWALKELKALLKIHQKNKNIFGIRGSYAGAFGIPQFLPSSYLKWGYDSDNNGTINLFLKPDAIYSTANYLKQHGWQPGLSKKQREKVIWHYNNSNTYARTIIGVSEKLKEKSRNRFKSKTLISQRSTQ